MIEFLTNKLALNIAGIIWFSAAVASLISIIMHLLHKHWPDIKEAIKGNVDRVDILYYSGLTFMGIGLWWFRPWVSFVTVGALLFLTSFVPFFIRARRGGD